MLSATFANSNSNPRKTWIIRKEPITDQIISKFLLMKTSQYECVPCVPSQLTFTYSKSTIEKLEKGVKYVQS